MEPRAGTEFGEYRIDGLIAAGGMGTVYRATARDGTAVALKVIKADLAHDETFRRRFMREARIAQRVRNPHVVPVRDAGEHDGRPYLAAALIDGITLAEKLEREGRLDLVTTVSVCAHVAAGLDALWNAGMVHRDVKPANILLDRAGTAYITDFGLARVTNGTVLTRPGQPLGSMSYMSPEQIRGEQVTGATDTYALGCVVFECVCGRPPFADRDGMGVLWAHLQDEPPECSAQRADISPAFSQALGAALRKLPAQRPSSSVAYARALARAAGIPIAETATEGTTGG